MTMTISEALTVIANVREKFYDAGDSCSGHELADALTVIRSRLEVDTAMVNRAGQVFLDGLHFVPPTLLEAALVAALGDEHDAA